MRRTLTACLALSVVTVALFGAPAASAEPTITFHGTIDGADCKGKLKIGAVTGFWTVNVTPNGGQVAYTMFEDGKLHAVLTPAYPWIPSGDGSPYVFTLTFPDTTATVTLNPDPVEWTLEIRGVPDCPRFIATGTGIAG